MKLKELLLFARTGGGSGILPAAARALRLPMPDDVLDQFILDHGLNREFQARYSELNLYAVVWSQELLQTEQIVGCTTKFDRYVRKIAERHTSATTLEQAVLHLDARRSWAEHGTWMRPPVFFRDLLPPPDDNHLVEGHTRVGALIGFRQNTKSPVRVSTTHACWVGRPSVDSLDSDWRAVRCQYPLSFKDWLYDAIHTPRRIAPQASALFDAEDRSRYTMTIGNSLEDLVRLLESAPVPGVTVSGLKELHREWAVELELQSHLLPTGVR